MDGAYQGEKTLLIDTAQCYGLSVFGLFVCLSVSSHPTPPPHPVRLYTQKLSLSQPVQHYTKNIQGRLPPRRILLSCTIHVSPNERNIILMAGVELATGPNS